jgi:hypothetical protein
MSDTADRLAQAVRELINEAIQEAVECNLRTPSPVRNIARPRTRCDS